MNPWLLLIDCFAAVLNCGFAVLMLMLVKRQAYRPRFIGIAVCLWALTMSLLFTLQIYEPAAWTSFICRWFYLPMAVEMVWNALLLQFLVLGLIILVFVLRCFRPTPRSVPPGENEMSRRKFIHLASYSAAPALAIGLGVHGTLTRDDLRVRHLDIPIVGLPPELEGFTIAHVSDLHAGLFVGPPRLKVISDATNDCKADLVVITGDIINREMPEFPEALAAIQRIESRHGTYLCEGNHDIIPGPGIFREACVENNLALLYGSGVTLPINGRRLLIAGLPWMRSGLDGLSPFVNSLYPQKLEGDVRILLAHHPHLFDSVDCVDLLLSGHTHGGQIMAGDVGLGPLFFKYWSGLYRRGSASMVVSNGCGDWFPCRIGAPAEIGLLRLTAATSTI